MIDKNCETWQDVVSWLQAKKAKVIEMVLATEAPERLSDYYRGAHAVLVELEKLPNRIKSEKS